MTRWTFFGRVLPERLPVRISRPEWLSEFPDLGFSYRIKIQIADGQFIVPATIETGQIDVHTLRNAVEYDIRIATDLVGYLIGGSFDVDMISAAADDGSSVIFGIKIPVLEASRTQATDIPGDLFMAIAADIPARMVLADFREAMRNPVGTGFFCYRAIEAIMQSMKADKDDKDAPAWEVVRTRLQIARPVIDAIKAHADYPRHGKVNSISAADRAMVFRLTDEIIKRYLAYLRGGKTALLSSEFPLFELRTVSNG